MALKQQMFGSMKPLTGDEYNTIFSVTGIDIDGRRELLQNSLIPHIEAGVKRFVVFVKAIPGFTNLPLNDQIALVKGIFAHIMHCEICGHMSVCLSVTNWHCIKTAEWIQLVCSIAATIGLSYAMFERNYGISKINKGLTVLSSQTLVLEEILPWNVDCHSRCFF